MIQIVYINCFCPDERGFLSLEEPLHGFLTVQGRSTKFTLSSFHTSSPDELKGHIESYLVSIQEKSVLIVGAHGHPSLGGFCVCNEPVLWHDLASLLSRMPKSSIFISYSCNGGFPGIAHAQSCTRGPTYIFGPRVIIPAELMQDATFKILEWYSTGNLSVKSASDLIDCLNQQAATAWRVIPKERHPVLRVIWSKGRYPKIPSPDRPDGSDIPQRDW